MISRQPSRLATYTVAILLVPLAIALTFLYIRLFEQVALPFFYLAICVSTWYGGQHPGLTTVVLSLFAINYYFIPPFYDWVPSPKDTFQLSVHVAVMLLIYGLTAKLNSARRRIEVLSQAQIQQSQDRLRQALQAANMGVWDHNLQTGEIIWSPEHERLFGLAPGTFDNRYETFESFLHPDDRQRVQQAVEQAFLQKGEFSCIFRIIWGNGEMHWLEGRGQILFDEAGRPIRLSGTGMNIDDRKQYEQALQNLNQELENRVE
ncbi:MAG TPA: PAS domain-containing protein, partial [Allocoleopsis sp.]